MGLCLQCVFVCAPLTLVGSILLFMISFMLFHKNWTFEVLAVKHDWDTVAKSRCCRNGGILYLAISVVLWSCIAIHTYLIPLDDPRFCAKVFRMRRIPSRSMVSLWRRQHKRGAAHDELEINVVVSDAATIPAPPPMETKTLAGVAVPPAANPDYSNDTCKREAENSGAQTSPSSPHSFV